MKVIENFCTVRVVLTVEEQPDPIGTLYLTVDVFAEYAKGNREEPPTSCLTPQFVVLHYEAPSGEKTALTVTARDKMQWEEWARFALDEDGWKAGPRS